MPIDWLAVRQPPIEAIEDGIAATDHYATTYTGPRTFERIDYPAAQTYPVRTTRSQGNEFTHRIEANLIFERTRGYDYHDDVLAPTAVTITECMAQLAATDSVVSFIPSEIEDYAGEMNNSGVVVVKVAFDVTTVHDLDQTRASAY